MAIEVGYPCFASGEPVRLSANAIRSIGADLRKRLFGFAVRPVDADCLAKRTTALSVNGNKLRIVWDMSHAVHDQSGEAVLGICEHDPSEPGTVLISLNADFLADQPQLLRSTAAHELGHAIFDMPAASEAGSARAFRSRAAMAPEGAAIDWKEWRADEFMGAFLAPKRQLTRAFTREASRHGLTLHWIVDEEIPSPFVRAREAGWTLIEGIAADVAEEIGVSDTFVAVRLRKYGLVR